MAKEDTGHNVKTTAIKTIVKVKTLTPTCLTISELGRESSEGLNPTDGRHYGSAHASEKPVLSFVRKMYAILTKHRADTRPKALMPLEKHALRVP